MMVRVDTSSEQADTWRSLLGRQALASVQHSSDKPRQLSRSLLVVMTAT